MHVSFTGTITRYIVTNVDLPILVCFFHAWLSMTSSNALLNSSFVIGRASPSSFPELYHLFSIPEACCIDRREEMLLTQVTLLFHIKELVSWMD
jgi:hypothetical protein